jgi:dTDP-4-dehydrorhamnose reductase
MGTILVFGGDGQVGNELVIRATQLKVPIRPVNRRDADIGDITQMRTIIGEALPSLVVNAAAYTKVDRAEVEAAEAFRTNAIAAGTVARVCGEAGIPLIHLSTDYVFDGTKVSAYVEDDTVSPINVYGHSKAQGEKAVRDSLKQHIILRTSWVYGVFGSNFLKTIVQLARERDELRIVADQRGSPTGTRDIADAILTIARYPSQSDSIWGTYHFCGSGRTTWYGFASEIIELQAQYTRRYPKLVAITSSEYPTAARRPANSELDCTRFINTFGFCAANWRERTRDVVSTLLS